MKKLMSMSLVLVLVLALGSLAFAGEIGGTTKAEIPVTAHILDYAQVIGVQGVNFGELEGAATTYSSNQSGHFTVEANTDVEIEVTFDDTDWLASPTSFGLSGGASNENVLPGFYANCPASFSQPYAAFAVDYWVTGNIEIERISQQLAKLYKAQIIITVSKQ